jgi:hypothetical protein
VFNQRLPGAFSASRLSHPKEAYMAQHQTHSQDHRRSGQPSPIAVQKALAGIEYPTTREHLAETARAHHADREIVALIDRLPDQNYDSPAAVSKALAQVQ